jgi:hypothetical protein
MNEVLRYAMVGSLLYATYLVLSCPCDAPVRCSKVAFYTATLAPVAATVMLDGS